MFIRPPFLCFITLTFVLTGACLRGFETSAVDAYSKQETNLSQQRFQKKSWTSDQQSDLMDKSFPFKQWDSRYSSLGSKKSDISVQELTDKKRFESEMVEFPTKEMDVSKWNGQLADLERQAQVSTNNTAKKVAEKRIYESAMKQSKSYSDTGEALSLRDINRFQFRQNRSDDAVPVRNVGGGS